MQTARHSEQLPAIAFCAVIRGETCMKLRSVNLTSPQLWARVQAYRFADITLADGPFRPARTLSFAQALACEERLLPASAERLIAEYRRFAYLRQVAPFALAPSVMLAKVRSLHRRDEEEYRLGFLAGCFCEEGLPKGDPTITEQGAGHRRARILYRQEFGTEPPADIWPAPVKLMAWTI